MGNTKTDQVARARWKKKLESWGMNKDEIALCMKEIAEKQKAKNLGDLAIDAPLCTRASYIQLVSKQRNVSPSGTTVLRELKQETYQSPDDKAFKPSRVDPVLKGTARATGATAKVVKRRKTITKYEYDQMNLS